MAAVGPAADPASAAPVVNVLPLVPGLALPVPAPAGTRRPVPSGYGVQEQCVPFTAATALGLLIPSPIAFGLCPPAEVPEGAHAFRSPLEETEPLDERVFYVHDDPRCRFAGNAFTLDPVPAPSGRGGPFQRVVPGLSFFDRLDQRDLFKVHLPLAWRTPPDVDCLFLPLLNRSGPEVLAGLVETDWYAPPVNLVVRRPATASLHLAQGDPIAQVLPIARAHRRPELAILPSHARLARNLRADLSAWYRRHSQDRSAYKRMSRERQRAR